MGKEITIVARGEGFMFKMVRSLAGFLIRVGQGPIPPLSHPKTPLPGRQGRQRSLLPDLQPSRRRSEAWGWGHGDKN